MATRRRLAAAARRLALEQGADAVTIEQVCAEVGVSTRTFFNYFSSKEEALTGPEIPAGTEASRESFVAGGPSGDLLADLLVLLDPSPMVEDEGREQLEALIALFEREPRLLARHLARLVGQEADVAALVARRTGRATDDPDCATVAALAQTLVRRACAQWFTDDAGGSLTSYLHRSHQTCVAVATGTLPSGPHPSHRVGAP